MDLTTKTDEQLREIAVSLQALADKNKYNKLKTIFPDSGPLSRSKYKDAMEFLEKGKDYSFRVFMGGNRSGKSFTTLAEFCYHATGEYPHWWKGKVFKKPTMLWIVAESGALFRDSAQKTLFGAAGDEVGTGFLPLAEKNNGIGITNWYSLPGTSGAIGSCVVKHKNGHNVTIIVKTGEMERKQFQAAEVDVVLFDEEPDYEIYGECLLRLMATGKYKESGIAMLAFTPLKGLSKVVSEFLPDGRMPKPGQAFVNEDQYVCRVEWNSVPHLSEDEKRKYLRNIPQHLRDARSKGIPVLGEGLVYPIRETDIVVEPFKIPDFWPRAFGLDFGWKCTAGLWGAKDPATDILYLYSEYYQGERSPELHAIALKAKGSWIPGICDPSGGGRDSDGSLVMELYDRAGVSLISGDNSVVAGIARNLGLLEAGQIKVFSTLDYFLREFRIYRYDEKSPNVPAKNQKDHLMDAFKYLTSQFDWVATVQSDMDEDSYKSNKLRSKNVDPLTGY